MYYFAYGSNMDINHFFQYICQKDVTIIGGAYVDDFIFRYRRVDTPKLKSGVANIEQRKKSKTYGIVYYIDDNCVFTQLDKKEGFVSDKNSSNKYHKIDVQCTLLENGKRLQCFTYQVNDYDHLPECPPRKQYMKYLVNGHKIHNLPNDHFKRIHYIY